MVRLRRVQSSMPGWTRVRHGRGFRYLDEDGRRLEPEQIERCKQLVIPPAWTDVWICPLPHGHLQATGTDDAGRRQYLYHPVWRENRDRAKFQKMQEFAEALLRRRTAVRRQLVGDELDLRQVCATTVALLDLGMFRIGSQQYVPSDADESGSYGLTTLLREHVRRSGEGLTFSYPGKSGQDIDVTVTDKPAILVLERMRRRRGGGGPQLLAYREGRAWQPVTSDLVNAYIGEMIGEGFTAKDFRTWRGTVIAALSLARADGSTASKRKKAVSAAMREVSEHLGNTPAVARSSYVDPRIVDLFEAGTTVDPTHRAVEPGQPVGRLLERNVLELLE